MFRSFIFALGIAQVVNAAGGARFSRDIILLEHAGTAQDDVEIRRWQRRVADGDANPDAYLRLAWAFVAKARRTSDEGYYTLADAAATAMEAAFGANPEQRLLRGHLLHMRHRFEEAEHHARGLVAARGAAEDFGLLSDVLMERGKLVEAVAALQRMVDLKPGAEAFCRVAHLRWLKGDGVGADGALREGLRATTASDVGNRAWILTRLSGFALQRGNVAEATSLAAQAESLVPNYAPALLARGRAEAGAGDAAAAAKSLRRAADAAYSSECLWWLADVLRTSGRSEEAAETERGLLERGAGVDPRTLALFLATRGSDAPAALRLARAEMKERQDVFTHDAVAWALAASGDFEAAEEAMKAALAEGTKDARLFLHAGEIACARGQRSAAADFFARARLGMWTLTPSERNRLEESHAAIAPTE